MLHWRDLSVVCCPCLLKPAEDRPGDAGLPGKARRDGQSSHMHVGRGSLLLFVFFVWECGVGSFPLASLAEAGGRTSVLGNFRGLSLEHGHGAPADGLDIALPSPLLFSLAVSSFDACT